ncbi:MAG: Calx-beta domain-containing protein, partial [Limisphaera sp.]
MPWNNTRTAWPGIGLLAAAWLGVGHLSAQPANDAFANAEVISGLAVSLTASLDQATSEPGEPSHAGATGLRTVWYKWTAPRSGEVTVDTLASPNNPDTVVAVYTGEQLTQLRQVAASDDNPVRPGAVLKPNYNFLRTSLLRFNAEEGREYYIAVGVKQGSPAELTLSLAYYPGGTFRFASELFAAGVPLYLCTEMESQFVGDRTTYATYYQYGVPGVLVTITRVGGSYGRMLVDYSTEDVEDPVVPDDIPAVAGQDYFPVSGTLVFDHGEMSKRILIQVNYDFGQNQPNREFAVILSNPRPDPAEAPEVGAPRIDGAWARAVVRILDIEGPPWDDPTNPPPPSVSFPRISFRVPEDVVDYFE